MPLHVCSKKIIMFRDPMPLMAGGGGGV